MVPGPEAEEEPPERVVDMALFPTVVLGVGLKSGLGMHCEKSARWGLGRDIVGNGEERCCTGTGLSDVS